MQKQSCVMVGIKPSLRALTPPHPLIRVGNSFCRKWILKKLNLKYLLHSRELLQNILQKPRKKTTTICKTQGQKIKPKTISKNLYLNSQRKFWGKIFLSWDFISHLQPLKKKSTCSSWSFCQINLMVNQMKFSFRWWLS